MKNNCTKTASLSVTDGLLNSANERLVSLLILLDLSAAFDTLDHKIWLGRLSLTFGIYGTAFKQLFTSYLLSLYGVPQGLVLGPIPFTLYTQPLPAVINDYSFNYRKFADETQLHNASQPGHFRSLITDSES